MAAMQSHVPKIQTINNVIRKMTSVNIYYMYMHNSIMIVSKRLLVLKPT